MEILLEIVIDFIMEVIVDGSKESWIPKPIRIFLLVLFLGIFGGITGGFVYLAITLNNIAGKVIFAGMAIGFVAFIVWNVRKSLK